jgi:hypothetical protein
MHDRRISWRSWTFLEKWRNFLVTKRCFIRVQIWRFSRTEAVRRSFGRAPPQVGAEAELYEVPTMTPYRRLSSTIGFDAPPCTVLVALKKYPGSNPHRMKDMKHIAEAVGRATPGRLDKKTRRAIVKTVRSMIRKSCFHPFRPPELLQNIITCCSFPKWQLLMVNITCFFYKHVLHFHGFRGQTYPLFIKRANRTSHGHQFSGVTSLPLPTTTTSQNAWLHRFPARRRAHKRVPNKRDCPRRISAGGRSRP